jgi:hypothetical protein
MTGLQADPMLIFVFSVLLIQFLVALQDLLTCKINNTLEKRIISKITVHYGRERKLEITNAKDVTGRFIILIYLNFWL